MSENRDPKAVLKAIREELVWDGTVVGDSADFAKGAPAGDPGGRLYVATEDGKLVRLSDFDCGFISIVRSSAAFAKIEGDDHWVSARSIGNLSSKYAVRNGFFCSRL